MCEKKYGNLKEFSNCIFLCIGTGIGGAYFANGKLVEPKKYPGFEIGHMIIAKNGNMCKCGKKGCFETYASMKKLKTDIANILYSTEEINGKKLGEILENNKQNEEVKNIIKEFVENLSIGISNIINIFEPEAIALGGGFAYYEKIFLEKLKKKIYCSNLLFNSENDTKIVVAKMLNDAGIIGATILE